VVLVEKKNKWIVIDDNNTILIITRDKSVALKFLQSVK